MREVTLTMTVRVPDSGEVTVGQPGELRLTEAMQAMARQDATWVAEAIAEELRSARDVLSQRCTTGGTRRYEGRVAALEDLTDTMVRKLGLNTDPEGERRFRAIAKGTEEPPSVPGGPDRVAMGA